MIYVIINDVQVFDMMEVVKTKKTIQSKLENKGMTMMFVGYG